MDAQSAVRWDVAILGAGAAGLMAGIAAAEHGARTLVLEKNRKPGVKILMSGGTRCNITHACDNRGIVAAYGRQGRFLHSPLATFGVDDVVRFFNGEGVATKIEDTGKVFPVNDKATDVLAALVNRLRRAGATLTLEEPVFALNTDPADGFVVRTNQRTLAARRIIVTTGGLSYPGCGTTGDGYGWARQFGHTIVPTRPALTPVRVAEPWVAELRGLTLADAQLRLWAEGDRKPLDARRGGLLFAHFGLSGPTALDISGAVGGHSAPSALRLELDLLPGESEAAVDAFVQQETLASGKQLLMNVLATRVQRRLGEKLMHHAGLPLDRRAAGLTRTDRQRLVEQIKRQRLAVTGILGYEKAEVTAGGVALEEVDFRTMQSHRQAGLYFAGEVLDLDGPIGGYNFQAAWSTGYLAGQSAAWAG